MLCQLLPAMVRRATTSAARSLADQGSLSARYGAPIFALDWLPSRVTLRNDGRTALLGRGCPMGAADVGDGEACVALEVGHD